ncbi:MarR family winged helix-turn-helix transcriptional regulator [Rubeoparvulum massiliense]|uniref:MarR family winged helix-turn-helix transcriptional regulator n=1 Tax=Rubeoparvulum massiliense TaxID=1631346 RepID=UPI00065E5590|nr:MarR family transcriptional regulator [Rubeoparvulum massiliense]
MKNKMIQNEINHHDVDKIEAALSLFIHQAQFQSVDEKRGLHMSQIYLLRTLALNKGPIKATRLAKTLGLTPGAITYQTNGLYEKGYISRKRDEEDGRLVLVEITEKGYEVLHEINKAQHRFFRQLLERLGEEYTQQFVGMLEKMLDVGHDILHERSQL